jgi:hypothetical protein
MNSSTETAAVVDQARQVICHRFAHMLNTGSFSVRARIMQAPDMLPAVRFYAHRNTGWQKEPDPITDLPLVRAIDEALTMVTSKEHADQFLTRKHAGSGYSDFDLQFNCRKLERRLGGHLEQALDGILFRDAHDAAKDERRAIRPPPRDGVRG